jgi:hypothetical protein
LAYYYLINAELVHEGVKLIFFNSNTNAWEEVVDSNYRPYFFIPHPVSLRDQEILEELRYETKVEEKREFFTGETISVTRVELEPHYTDFETI